MVNGMDVEKIISGLKHCSEDNCAGCPYEKGTSNCLGDLHKQAAECIEELSGIKGYLRLYRKKIADAVEDKMCYMGSCPNEKEIILSIIAPKDYKRDGTNHCLTDCWITDCVSHKNNRIKG